MDLDLRACEGRMLPQDKCSSNAEMDVKSVTIYSSPNPPQQNPNSTRKSGGVCNQDCERKVIGEYAKSTILRCILALLTNIPYWNHHLHSGNLDLVFSLHHNNLSTSNQLAETASKTLEIS